MSAMSDFVTRLRAGAIRPDGLRLRSSNINQPGDFKMSQFKTVSDSSERKIKWSLYVVERPVAENSYGLQTIGQVLSARLEPGDVIVSHLEVSSADFEGDGEARRYVALSGKMVSLETIQRHYTGDGSCAVEHDNTDFVDLWISRDEPEQWKKNK